MTNDWSQLAHGLSDTLNLTSPPVAITFSDDAPVGVDPFDAPMPSPTRDGRTGRVPAGCVFWVRAADRTFSTVADDHANCSVGSVTHGFKTLDEVAGNADAPPGHDDEPLPQPGLVDPDRVEPFVELEWHRLDPVLDGPPTTAHAGSRLDSGPSQDERPVIGVLELLLAVDPALDADVAGLSGAREPDRLADRDQRRRREEPADPVATPEAQQHRGARREHGQTGADEEEGGHGCR